ncbi:bacterioferritin [Balneatrix alpica]|uniref:bacterioferritin n=1 Tax=Balneatrix alpica TaxID=75684 RepID=UPI0027390EDC|nr:bacterioferritin [Balneatrix alpica]
MQGHPDVIAALNRLLASELSAVDQYFIHSRMYEDWGLTKLYERIGHEMDDEKGHADILIKRILFLQGIPNVALRDALRIGQDVPSMLANDLLLEQEVGEALKDAIALCEQVRDYQTRDQLCQLLEDTEEDHAHWLEQQLGLIKLMGLENYLQSQL